MVPVRKMAKNLALALRIEDYDGEDYIDIADAANSTAANVNTNDNVIGGRLGKGEYPTLRENYSNL